MTGKQIEYLSDGRDHSTNCAHNHSSTVLQLTNYKTQKTSTRLIGVI